MPPCTDVPIAYMAYTASSVTQHVRGSPYRDHLPNKRRGGSDRRDSSASVSDEYRGTEALKEGSSGGQGQLEDVTAATTIPPPLQGATAFQLGVCVCVCVKVTNRVAD
ncbi:hypothetical protein Vafri_1970, partial [Volvox africanus]